jgi:hypothetical protein
MKLREARLCLDCDEVYQEGVCPGCGSETFAYLSRWVPAPEGNRAPRPATSEQAEVFRELLTPNLPESNRRLLKRGLLGLTAIGLAGWAWRTSRAAASQSADSREPTES